jgi:hypothetical protein
MDALTRIKRLAYKGKVSFTEKALAEMRREHIISDMVIEAILNAPAIAKTLRSRNPKTGKREYLYVLLGQTFDGLILYTKGKIETENGESILYLLISSKRSVG